MLRFLDAKIVEGDEATILKIEDCPAYDHVGGCCG
jgi:hypothetical protein